MMTPAIAAAVRNLTACALIFERLSDRHDDEAVRQAGVTSRLLGAPVGKGEDPLRELSQACFASAKALKEEHEHRTIGSPATTQTKDRRAASPRPAVV